MLVANVFKELTELLEKLLETLGLADDPSEESKILFEMLENALGNNLLEEFLEVIEQSGKSLQDVLRSIIIDHGRDLLEALVHTWIALQRPIQDLLDAVKEVQEEALDEVVRIIMEMFARHMTPAEIAQAQLVYGSSLDYETIYFSVDGVINDVVFGVQDFFNQNPNSRAFVTAKLVNHDVDDGHLTHRTMIHELCHVWQYEKVGLIYGIQAGHAQVVGGLEGFLSGQGIEAGINSAYNYGYTNGVNGNGGANDLNDAINNNPGLSVFEVFEGFNREQQAQIIMHYYQRKYVESPALNVTAWQPFADLVYL